MSGIALASVSAPILRSTCSKWTDGLGHWQLNCFILCLNYLNCLSNYLNLIFLRSILILFELSLTHFRTPSVFEILWQQTARRSAMGNPALAAAALHSEPKRFRKYMSDILSDFEVFSAQVELWQLWAASQSVLSATLRHNNAQPATHQISGGN